MQQTITVGLVAYGMSGQVFHAPFLHTLPGFQLKTVVERHAEKSKERYPYVNVVRSLDELLADDSIELVVVTTPNHLHYADTKKALEAGKHVVVEKPFVENTTQAEELIALAKRQNRHLIVYQNRRWDSDFQTVKKVLAQGMLGDLVHFESHYDRYVNYIRPGNTWKEDTQGATGVLYDLGAHLIDQALQLFGAPKAVTGDLRVEREGSRIIDNFHLTLHYDRPRVLIQSNMLVRELGPRFILHGVNGSFLKWGLDPQEAALKAGRWPNEAGWGTEPENLWGKLNTQWGDLHTIGRIETVPGDYNQFYHGVYAALTEDAPVPVKPEEALLTQKVIEAAIRSAEEGRQVAP
ncbi:Predicted dehydrogenase [Catalinimonas alkaloidigena]|uniref:Predicted dehydrogenase n=1 Tax=Catalinimonas alkaloidigena TaxID=1075417 RepID=A0A1G9RGZ0_9BACT|nr:oxidoreductase [Catalinimonas alkaloidigena]SDM22592.1 Predicted dehydrogenase [Catalinimonas alkaloidigena]